MYSSYKLVCAFGVAMSPVFSYCSGAFINGTEAQQKFVARIAEIELSVVSFDAFFQAVRVGLVKRFSFSHFVEECDGPGVLMKVLEAMIKEWIDFSTLLFIDRIDVDLTLVLVAVAHLCEINWYALS